jgi:hypothetical protein
MIRAKNSLVILKIPKATRFFILASVKTSETKPMNHCEGVRIIPTQLVPGGIQQLPEKLL